MLHVSMFEGFNVQGFKSSKFQWLKPFLCLTSLRASPLNGCAVSMFNFVEGFAVHVYELPFLGLKPVSMADAVSGFHGLKPVSEFGLKDF